MSTPETKPIGTPIYVYTVDHDGPMEAIFGNLLGLRYMALTGEKWPYGKIEAYGYTATGAYRRALRKLKRKLKRKAIHRDRVLVAQWTDVGERVR